jgi:hypothetical protein
MNFSELKTEVKRLTGRNDTQFDARIEQAINRALRHWARLIPWDGLQRVEDITHNGGRTLIFPAEVDRVRWIMDKTNFRPVEAGSQWDRDDTYSWANDTANYADEWQLDGFTPVMTGVSGPLEVYTSDASDVVTVWFQGQVLASGGTAPQDLYRVGETVNIAGTTPVTTTNSYYNIEAIVKDADTTGYLEVKSQGTVVGRIDRFERSPAHVRVRFMDIPATGTVFKYGAFLKPTPLVNDNQTTHPSVEPDFLIWEAAKDVFWQLREGTRATAAKRQAEEIAGNAMSKDRMFSDWEGRVVPEDLE